MIDYSIRLGILKDTAFIKDAWQKSMHHIYPHQYETGFSQRYQAHMQTLIENSITLVAHLPDDEDEILSFLIYTFFNERLVCHFAYTKVGARKEGLLTALIKMAAPNAQSLIFTHPPKNENIMEHFIIKFIYDPSVLQVLPCL